MWNYTDLTELCACLWIALFAAAVVLRIVRRITKRRQKETLALKCAEYAAVCAVLSFISLFLCIIASLGSMGEYNMQDH